MMNALVPVLALCLMKPPAEHAVGQPAKDLGTASQKFASDLLRAMNKKQANVFCSPYSLQTALWMAGTGAHGQTQTQMREGLHLNSSSESGFSAVHQLLSAEAAAKKPEGAADNWAPLALNAANRLWYSKSFAMKPAYVSGLKSTFGADAETLDFTKPAAAAGSINDWVSDQTHKRIKELVTPQSIPAAGLVLTNAVYFKGAWGTQFDATKELDFTTAEGKVVKPKGMVRNESCAYQDLPHAQAVQIGYQGNASMTIILPEKGKFEQVLSTLDFTKLNLTYPGRKVYVTMPQFSIHSHSSVASTLAGLGMTDAFDSAKADFSGLAPVPTYIADVIHAANIDVDEKGTEAAAATAVLMAPTSAPAGPPSKPIVFTADRPFIFMITHSVTGEVLFAGIVNDPTGK